MAFRQNPLLGYWARGLEHQTKAEQALEPAVAALGLRYRCQHAFMRLKYFADFALLDQKLIIEVDGDSHETPAQKEKDLLHTLAVLELGWNVARVSNEQALQNPAATVERALTEAETLRSLGTESVAEWLKGRLGRLRQSYPHLLVASAKKSKKKSRASIAAARTRASSSAAGACSPRKRAGVALPLA